MENESNRMENYEILGHIGEGAHGAVLKAKCKASGMYVAIKRVPHSRIEGVPPTILRKLRMLKTFDHKNVLQMIEVIFHDTNINLVLEYMSTNLSIMINDPDSSLSEPLIKTYMGMILKGVDHIHGHRIMHRDLRPSNFLIAPNGILKISGLEQTIFFHQTNRPTSTPEIVARWYKAPELLYGARSYDEGIDLWALGCILGEMINKRPLFGGKNEMDQLDLVLRALGTPTEDTWPGVTGLPNYNQLTFPSYNPTPMEVLVPNSSEAARKFIRRFLLYPSKDRISAAEALFDEYFFTQPLPFCACDLPHPVTTQHEGSSTMN